MKNKPGMTTRVRIAAVAVVLCMASMASLASPDSVDPDEECV